MQTEAIPKTYYAYFLVMKRAKKRVLRDGIVPHKAYNNIPVPPYFSLFLSLILSGQQCSTVSKLFIVLLNQSRCIHTLSVAVIELNILLFSEAI